MVRASGAERASPVQLGHNKRVAFPYRCEGLIKAWPRTGSPRKPVIGVDTVRGHAEGYQGLKEIGTSHCLDKPSVD